MPVPAEVDVVDAEPIARAPADCEDVARAVRIATAEPRAGSPQGLAALENGAEEEVKRFFSARHSVPTLLRRPLHLILKRHIERPTFEVRRFHDPSEVGAEHAGGRGDLLGRLVAAPPFPVTVVSELQARRAGRRLLVVEPVRHLVQGREVEAARDEPVVLGHAPEDRRRALVPGHDLLFRRRLQVGVPVEPLQDEHLALDQILQAQDGVDRLATEQGTETATLDGILRRTIEHGLGDPLLRHRNPELFGQTDAFPEGIFSIGTRSRLGRHEHIPPFPKIHAFARDLFHEVSLTTKIIANETPWNDMEKNLIIIPYNRLKVNSW